MFQEVSTRANFPEMEKDVRRFWKEKDIFARSVRQREGKPFFVFYEGPPTANGRPGIHHVLARAMKDLFPRYKTMRGFQSERKGGWDTHRLPVEIEDEKQLKLNGKEVLAAGEFVADVQVRTGDKSYIVAKVRLAILQGSYEVEPQINPQSLLGKRYKPLYPYQIPNKPAFFVVDADFVSVEDGTGIVHTAAAYGVDDLELSLKKGIPVRHVVDLSGRFKPEVEPFAGLFVKKADPKIIEDLTQRGLMYRAETIRHTYPFCWRCGTPLLYYALTSWFIKTTSVKDELIRNNNLVNWVPPYVGTGRMANWLETLVDWSLSRWRYWGTPLPIWVCEQCDERRCVGSVTELGLTLEDDLHRPYIDRVTLPCTKCDGVMRRVADLIDVWFDSGSMPMAQFHYPFENVEIFQKRFPADFISEALDQTRGWFYSLLAIATMLFKQPAFKNVIVNGTVLDKQGRKMSKSLKNSVDPMEVMSKFGADATRWYFFSAVAVAND